MQDVIQREQNIEALVLSILDHFEQFLRLSLKMNAETYSAVSDIEEPGRLADVIMTHLQLKESDKQSILELANVEERLEKLLGIINNEREILELERKITSRVKKQMEKTQKEYYLREQMKAIQRELGDKEGRAGEV